MCKSKKTFKRATQPLAFKRATQPLARLNVLHSPQGGKTGIPPLEIGTKN